MLLTDETIRGEVRVRTLACDECPPEDECGNRFLAFQARHEQLWVTLLWVKGGEQEAADELDKVIVGLDDLPDIVERYLALVGLTWPVLVNAQQACMDQILVCNSLPDWMTDLDVALLWDTRRCVFGHDLIRVPRALKAAHRYYVPDSPALEPWGR